MRLYKVEHATLRTRDPWGFPADIHCHVVEQSLEVINTGMTEESFISGSSERAEGRIFTFQGKRFFSERFNVEGRGRTWVEINQFGEVLDRKGRWSEARHLPRKLITPRGKVLVIDPVEHDRQIQLQENHLEQKNKEVIHAKP